MASMQTNDVIARIARIREKANACIVAELTRRGIRGMVPSHGSILHMLFQHGPLPMGRLAAMIGRKKNTVTTLVRKLAVAGYVTCAKDEADSRVVMVSLTEAGLAIRPAVEAISRELLARVWGDMPEVERQALVAGLARLEANLG
jgi:DNA-binding MarR family transcriptional regulator